VQPPPVAAGQLGDRQQRLDAVPSAVVQLIWENRPGVLEQTLRHVGQRVDAVAELLGRRLDLTAAETVDPFAGCAALEPDRHGAVGDGVGQFADPGDRLRAGPLQPAGGAERPDASRRRRPAPPLPARTRRRL
jgi:hypothetical protein